MYTIAISTERRVSEPLGRGYDSNPPLRILIDARAFLPEMGPFFAHDQGRSPERLHRPNRFSVWLLELEGGRVGIHVMTGVDPGYPQRGPYEGSEGIYPDRGQGKTGGGQAIKRLVKIIFLKSAFPLNVFPGAPNSINARDLSSFQA